MKEIQAFYKPDRTARAFWSGRLEGEYPVEVLKMGGKKLAKALISTRKGVVVAVPQYCIVLSERGKMKERKGLCRNADAYNGTCGLTQRPCAGWQKCPRYVGVRERKGGKVSEQLSLFPCSSSTPGRYGFNFEE